MRLSELVFDFALYPRGEVDSQHASYIREAIRAGVKLPPIVICAKTKRVIDGFHRGRAYRLEFGDDAEVEVVEKRYKTDADAFLDAVRYNASHGRNLSAFDRAHCALLAESFAITTEQLASALSITTEKLGALRVGRIGKLHATFQPADGGEREPIRVPLKRSIDHMAGRKLTAAQNAANEKLSGMRPEFHVNQLLLLIDNGLLDASDENLIERLRLLQERLDSLLAVA